MVRLRLLLDTNICIALINGSSVVRSRLLKAWSRRHEVCLSTIVIFELAYGVAKSHPNRKQDNAERLAVFLRNPFLTLPFTSDDAAAAGQIRAELASRGTPIGTYDLLIAGQALANGLTLVTANESEFSRVSGLKWQNWITTVS